MSIDQHVPVTVSVNNSGIALTGFGTIAVLSYKEAFPELSRSYGKLSDLIADGFAADSVEARAVGRIFGQSPHPAQVKIIRGVNVPTLVYELAVLEAVEGFVYKLKVKGEGFADTTISYTATGGDDEGDIAGELITQLNAVTDKNYTAVADGSDPSLIVVTGTAPGDWFSIEVLDTTMISIENTTADPDVAADLAAIQLYDDNWYYLETNFNSAAMVLATADYIESAGFKFYAVDLVDSAIENGALGGGDLADQLHDLGWKRTAYAYHRKPNDMMVAGWEGRLCPLQVGTWDAAYKSLTGVTADSFSATQMNNMDDKKCSYYKAEAGRSFTWNGAIANTDYKWFDVTVSLDFVIDLIQKRVLGARLALNKVTYTDEDIQGVIKGAVQGAIDEAKSEAHRIIALGTPGDPDDPEPTVFFPRVADIDPSDRALRVVPDGDVSFRLQGAVNVVPINLTVTF
jgi:hypothetical protein